MIDGKALPGEWDGAARYDADTVTGSGLTSNLSILDMIQTTFM